MENQIEELREDLDSEKSARTKAEKQRRELGEVMYLYRLSIEWEARWPYGQCAQLQIERVITMVGERKGLQQNKQLSEVSSILTSVKEIAKRSDLPFKIISRKLLKIQVNKGVN